MHSTNISNGTNRWAGAVGREVSTPEF